MANSKREQGTQPPLGSTPAAPKDSRSERDKLITDPNRNQAGNERGSADNTQGSQTGNDIDTAPDV
jgi:hypothetical protein